MALSDSITIRGLSPKYDLLGYFFRSIFRVKSFIGKTFSLKKRFIQLYFIAWTLWLTPGLSREKKFRLFFERSGGAFIKLGQILSMRYDILPESYVAELLGLLSNVQAVPTEEMREVFKSERGVYPEEYFSWFDSKPLASASISQVYRARLSTGEEVVVKIKRPGIDKIFEADFVLARFLGFIMWPFSFFRSVDIDETVNDFINWTRHELDFNNEVANACVFYKNCEQFDDIIIPAVYPSHSTRKVMVSEYIETIFSVEDIIFNLESDKNFEKILKKYYGLDAEALAYRFIIDGMRQFFVDGFFHADPHPANIFFLPGNKLGYFDFGIVGTAGFERRDLLQVLYGFSKEDFNHSALHMLSFTKQALDREVELLKKYQSEKYELYKPAIEKIEDILADEIAEDFSRILAPLYSSGKEKINSSLILAEIFMKTNQYSIYLPHNVAIFFRSLIIADMVALRLCPHFDIIKALQMFFEQYSLESILADMDEKEEASRERVIDPTETLTYEEMLEVKDAERDRLDATVEYLIDIASLYAENYEEVRNLLKGN